MLPNFSAFRKKEISKKDCNQKKKKKKGKRKRKEKEKESSKQSKTCSRKFSWKSVWCYQRINSKQHQTIWANSIQPVINVIVVAGNFQLCQSINSK